MAALASHMPSDVSAHTVHPSGAWLRVQRWGFQGELESVLRLGKSAGTALETALVAAIAGTGASVLHVHSPMLGAASVARAIRTTGVRAMVTLHDGALVSENHELLEGGERFCGIPEDLRRCDECLARTLGRPPGRIVAWRREMAELVEATDAFVAPSESVLESVAKIHPAVRSRVRRIPWGVPPPHALSTAAADAPGPLRVAVVGMWATAKGARRLPLLLSACRGLNVEWHLFGATEGASPSAVRGSGALVTVHGAYHRARLAEKIVQSGCQIALLASVAAESFSLTLSELLAIGLPVIASDLGALGERVRRDRLGWVFDPWDPRTLARVLVDVEKERSAIEFFARRIRERPLRTEAEMARDHAEVVRSLVALGPKPHDERRLDGARAEYAAGQARARKRRRSVLARAVVRLRRSDAYRDLRLRKILPEETRHSIELAAARIFCRGGRS